MFGLITIYEFRPHRRIMYVDAAYCYRPSSVVYRWVCRSVTVVSLAKTDRDAVSVEDSTGPKESCIRCGFRSPGDGAIFEGRKGGPFPVVKYRDAVP